MRSVAFSLVALCAALSHGQLKPPPPENEDLVKFNMTKRAPTSAAVRLSAYENRLKLEAMSPYSRIEWRSAGPVAQGGRVIAFNTPASVPNKYYVAYATGGLWRSEDMGNRWTPIFDSTPGVAIGDFALSKDGKTIWVGTGENNSQRTSYDGMGVFKSTDEGKTWTYSGLAETQRIGRVLINPKNENVVYVGAIGGLYSTSPDRGVYKTSDGGKSWTQVLKVDDATGVIDLVMDPRNPDTIYAAAWDRERRAWNIKDGGPGTGIYKTTDGGKNWQRVMNGFPDNQSLGRIGLTISPAKPERVYAYVDNRGGDLDDLYRDEWVRSGVLTPKRFLHIKDPAIFAGIEPAILTTFVTQYMPQGTKADEVIADVKAGKMTLADIAKKMEERNARIWEMPVAESEIYRTDDGGKAWKKMNAQYLDTSGYGYYCGRITAHPTNPDEIVVMNMLLYRSRDGGKTFEVFGNSMHVDHHAYWYDPKNPNFQACGNDGGIYWSFDGGGFWRQLTQDMSVGQFTTLALDNKTPYNIYGGLQDNGTLKGPNTHNPSTSPASQWTRLGGGDGSAIVVDPRNESEVVYGSSQFGSFFGLDQKTNQRWSFGGRPAFAEATGLRWNWISPIVVSKHKPDTIYIGSNRVHRSEEQGRAKWATISPDLTTNTPNGDVPFSTVKDLSESPFKYGVLYAGTDDGKVWVTEDDGANWKDISTPANKWVARIVASRHDANTVYVAQTGYRDDDYTPYLFKSTDMGKTWTSITGNLPNEMLNTVREDPTNKDWLYVGTDLGVFMSRDGGGNWVPLHGALPRTPVHDIQLHERDKDMVIASHARGVWVLQMEKIYELTDELMAKDFHLWPVSNMTRGDWERRRVFLPEAEAEEASAPGAPQGRRGGLQGPGGALRGELWTREGGKGSIRLKDKDGKVVKEVPMVWARGYNPWTFDLLLKEASRFTVDPKAREIKTSADAVKDPFEAERPVYVPAGDYTIEFVIGSKTESVEWKLTPP